MTPLAQLLEAALFSAARPLTVEELATLDQDATLADVRVGARADPRALRLRAARRGAAWRSPAATRSSPGRCTRPRSSGPSSRCGRPKLTAAALETLAVIAYRQPVGRAEIEEIRGVSAGGVLRSLQERGLIEVVGRSEALGRPLLYGTAPMFLELLGLRDLADLPRAEELTIALQPHRPAPRARDDAAAYVEAES